MSGSQLSPRSVRSRRDFLRAAGAAGSAGSALLLLACGDGGGGDEGKTTTAPMGGGDVRVLNAVLELEHATVAAYALGEPLLEGRVRALGKRFLAQEREHVAALRHAVKALGATPVRSKSPSEYRRSFPMLRTRGDVLRFALDLEQTAVTAYVSAIPKLTSAELRQSAAAINSNEAEHISLLLTALGRPAVPNAFLIGKPPARQGPSG